MITPLQDISEACETLKDFADYDVMLKVFDISLVNLSDLVMIS